jgi:hypothetical protein
MRDLRRCQATKKQELSITVIGCASPQFAFAQTSGPRSSSATITTLLGAINGLRRRLLLLVLVEAA